MKPGTVITTFPNPEDGATGLVVAGANGKFHACLRDDETGNVIGLVRICDTQSRAEEIARKWANAR